MKFRTVLSVVVVCMAVPGLAQAQLRWDKFQQKLEDLRPKGKLLQQVKDGLEGTNDAAQKKPAALKSNSQAAPTNTSATGKASRQNSGRNIPAQNASRQSILNMSRNLPTGGVVLGIQIDPKFLPAQKLIVSEVERNSPAGKAGLRSGDQITAVGGTPTPSLKSLDGVLASLNSGDQVMVELVRNRKAQKVLVRFESADNGAPVTVTNQVDTNGFNVPAPPDLSEIPAISPTDQSAASLRSVLAAPPNSIPLPSGTRSAPAYFPSGSENPRVIGSGQLNPEFGRNAGGITIDQLQEQIRQQQQLIEQLNLRIQQLQSGYLPADETIEVDSLILDADGN